MKNVTISMDDDLAQRTRVAAAQAGMSVSKFLAEAAREKIAGDAEKSGSRNRQLEAVERILAGPKWDVTVDGRMPTAEERNARR
ncbi:MAG TPA: ribbon-helix-helix protein, CopG family [Rhizobiales bacterium]|nr:ribbon-helix-helix protein, CopG family [Hyphomicrobiales bacterium]